MFTRFFFFLATPFAQDGNRMAIFIHKYSPGDWDDAGMGAGIVAYAAECEKMGHQLLVMG